MKTISIFEVVALPDGSASVWYCPGSDLAASSYTFTGISMTFKK